MSSINFSHAGAAEMMMVLMGSATKPTSFKLILWNGYVAPVVAMSEIVTYAQLVQPVLTGYAEKALTAPASTLGNFQANEIPNITWPQQSYLFNALSPTYTGGPILGCAVVASTGTLVFYSVFSSPFQPVGGADTLTVDITLELGNLLGGPGGGNAITGF